MADWGAAWKKIKGVGGSIFAGQHLSEIRYPFARAQQLPGLHRWRLYTRIEPRGPWLASIFVSASRREIELRVARMDAHLAKKHKKRENLKKTREQEHVHQTGRQGAGGHVPGPMAKCSVCREALWKSTGRKR